MSLTNRHACEAAPVSVTLAQVYHGPRPPSKVAVLSDHTLVANVVFLRAVSDDVALEKARQWTQRGLNNWDVEPIDNDVGYVAPLVTDPHPTSVGDVIVTDVGAYQLQHHGFEPIRPALTPPRWSSSRGGGWVERPTHTAWYVVDWEPEPEEVFVRVYGNSCCWSMDIHNDEERPLSLDGEHAGAFWYELPEDHVPQRVLYNRARVESFKLREAIGNAQLNRAGLRRSSSTPKSDARETAA